MPPPRSSVPVLFTDWPQLRPEVWLVRLLGGQAYRIERVPRGFQLLAFNGCSCWIGPGGHSRGKGRPPVFRTAQDAVDAAVAHYAQGFGGKS